MGTTMFTWLSHGMKYNGIKAKPTEREIISISMGCMEVYEFMGNLQITMGFNAKALSTQ